MASSATSAFHSFPLIRCITPLISCITRVDNRHRSTKYCIAQQRGSRRNSGHVRFGSKAGDSCGQSAEQSLSCDFLLQTFDRPERGHDNRGFSLVEYQRFLADANEEHVGSICARWRARWAIGSGQHAVAVGPKRKAT